jgi:radical SAM-linked protein
VTVVTNDPRQRWRLVVARDAAAREMVHRDVVVAWEAGLRASGLPLCMSEAATPRPRITFAAPAQVGVLAERELIDIVLTELILIHDVRAAVEAGAPPGYRPVDLYDVWLAGPSLASLVTAADYRATVTTEVDGEVLPAAIDAAEVEAAVGAVLAAPRLERVRMKGQGDVTVDIRPHLHQLRMAAGPGLAAPGLAAGPGSFELWMRLRLGGEGGVGRPEEIVAALGDQLGRRLVPGRLIRERVILADDRDE